MKSALQKGLSQISTEVDAYPWEDARAYGDWLAQTYFYVRHSTRLLALAASRFPCDEQGEALHQRFGAHMGEEKRHDLLALHDLKAVGASLATLPERHSARALYEPQYFKVEHQGPFVLFGYILVLEGLSIERGKHILQRVEAVHGRAAGTFVRLHAEDDPDHIQKAFSALEGVDEATRALITQNIEQSAFQYCALMRDLRSGG